MYKIAVIEDDTLLGQALVEMLTSHGYQAFAAESVTKAAGCWRDSRWICF